MAELTKYHDAKGNPIPYGALLDFTWWEYVYTEIERHLVARIRKRKSGDIFEFIKDSHGRDCYFTHRLTALNWTEDDLELLDTPGPN